MKTCTKCNLSKDETEFAIKNSKTGLRQSYCKECHNKYSKNHYLNNKSKYLAKSNRLNKIYEKRNTQLVKDVKTIGCQLCSEKCLACLDFHHLEGKDKLNNIARLMRHSTKYLEKEISKCIILCSNCHRKLHANLIQLPKANGGVEPPSPDYKSGALP